MNEIDPITPPPLPDFKDRGTGLIVFGIFEILIGFFCLLLVGLMMFLQHLPKPPGTPEMDFRTMIPSFIIYGALAIGFVWLGIGSIQARRWARDLLLVGSAGWLAV